MKVDMDMRLSKVPINVVNMPYEKVCARMGERV